MKFRSARAFRIREMRAIGAALLFAQLACETPMPQPSATTWREDEWPKAGVRVRAEGNAPVVSAFDCTTGRPLRIARSVVFGDILQPSEICEAEEVEAWTWTYGMNTKEPCPPLRPGKAYRFGVQTTKAPSGAVTVEVGANGRLLVRPSPCGEASRTRFGQEEFCRMHSSWEECSGVSVAPPPKLSVAMESSGDGTVFRATDCSTNSPHEIWRIDVYADRPPPESHVCHAVPGGVLEWHYGDDASKTCDALVPGVTYLVIAHGVGRGAATFRLEENGVVQRLSHCGPLTPLPHLTEYYCQAGEAHLCGTDDLGTEAEGSSTPAPASAPASATPWTKSEER